MEVRKFTLKDLPYARKLVSHPLLRDRARQRGFFERCGFREVSHDHMEVTFLYYE